MMYKVEYTQQSIKELQKLDRSTSAMIYAWIEKNLIGCENPRQKGKGLTANRSGQWRYRVGDYRIIADISEETNEDKTEKITTILILTIAHRREVYD